jgi:hypothetical protein
MLLSVLAQRKEEDIDPLQKGCLYVTKRDKANSSKAKITFEIN